MLQRIRRSGVPLIALTAPAGYGKSYIAQRIAREDPHWTIVDANVASDREGFARALASLPKLAPAAESLSAGIAAWAACEEPITLILENLENATDAGVLEAIAELVRTRPHAGKLILCSRRTLPIALSDLAAPHLLVTLRADDLRFDAVETAQLFAETHADETALFAAGRFTEGWPVVALYLQRLVQEGALDAHAETVPDRLLRELFDYVDAQVVAKLPPAEARALIVASGWNDLTETEIETALGDAGAVAALIDVHQLARAGTQERIDVHPLVRRTVHRRHRRQLISAMRALAEQFVADEAFARAAECYLVADDVAAAAECAMHVEGGFLTLVGSRAATGAGDDALGIAMHPEIRLAVASARRLLEPSRNLPREALAVLETTRGETDALERAALGVTVLTLLDAGRTAEAQALMETAPPDGENGPNGPGVVLLSARLALLAQLGRFEEGMRLWQPLRRRIDGNAVWLAQLLRFEVQAARAQARWEVEHEAVERMVALARGGRAIPVIALALAEAVFGAWLAGEDDLFEAYRTELGLVIERHNVPAMTRFMLAASGRAPRLGQSNVPLWDARAFLLAAASAPDGATAARYAQAALEAGDVADEPLTRVLVRICVAEKAGAARARLREALALSEGIGTRPLRDAVSALAERGDVRGMLAPFVNRLRHRTAMAVAAEDAQLEISLADGTVSRGEDRVDVSEGVLALLLALAVEGQSVGRDRLVDRLWPDLPEESAYNALKMCVHRARGQLADPSAVVVSRGGYALAPEIDVDLRWLQRALERIRRDAVPEGDLPRLEEIFERLVRGRPAAFANWEWFEPVERELEAATREVGAYVAARALRAGDHVRALGIAHALTKLDPLDEAARQIAISAHIAANDRGAAILEYRGYRELLREELDVEPSAELLRLLEAG
ncbi:MAG TPA: BTAD domain-containing putative transcriptional regulator [Candidatus Elarobacter sp.]|nr:BTAD domain-containing putative transcriptional regulator [Candidatus Elarobacter sp.]